jgi:hypothetical protein
MSKDNAWTRLEDVLTDWDAYGPDHGMNATLRLIELGETPEDIRKYLRARDFGWMVSDE